MASLVALKDTLLLAVTSWRLWTLQFVGNVVLFLIFIWFLRTPDAHWWQVLFGFLLLVVTVLGALVLHGGTLDFFQIAHEGKQGTIGTAFTKAVRHLPALLLWAVIFFAFQWLVGKLDRYNTSLPGYLRSEFPAWLRRWISEPAFVSLYTDIVWLLRWVVLPGLLLPFAVFSVDQGFGAFLNSRGWRKTVRSLIYWMVLLVAALIGVALVRVIMHWLPDPRTATLQQEQTSLVFRLLLAYILGIFSWLLACSMLGRRTANVAVEPGAQPV